MRNKLNFDTPVFVLRMFGRNDEQLCVEKLVAENECISSHYVREQFRSAFIKTTILAFNLLLTHREVPEVLRRLDQFPVTTGEGKKARQALIRVMSLHTNFEDMLATLERWIECEMLACVEDGIALNDSTRCCHVALQPTKNDLGLYSLPVSCTLADPRPCRIEEFWRERESLLEAQATTNLMDIPQAGRTQNVAASQAATREVLDGKRPRGRMCMVTLSDSVIVAESPDETTLVTTNIGDFVGITALMRRDQTVRKPTDICREQTPVAVDKPQ
jgi:hypothetical protein